MLANNEHLKSLNLASDKINPEELKFIIEGLMTGSKLMRLHLGKEHFLSIIVEFNNIGDEGAALFLALPFCNAKKIYLRENGIGIDAKAKFEAINKENAEKKSGPQFIL